MKLPILLYTQYPLNSSCDQKAIYPVQVLAWDENKYCLVHWNGKRYMFKLWYCYVDERLTEEVRLNEKILKEIPGRAIYQPLCAHFKNLGQLISA